MKKLTFAILKMIFMKKLLKALGIFVLVIGLLMATAYMTGNGYLMKGLWVSYLHGYNSASIGDARFFKTHTIETGTGSEWPLAENYNQTPLSNDLKSSLEKGQTVAFLVIKNDSIVTEEYWDSYTATSHSNSFSMARAVHHYYS